MARFRLRFLLQEFDLSEPEVVIGRSPDCHVTIEDPLVSREHARIRVEQETATIEDLSSRNGVRINGNPLHGRQVLSHGDRLRLGTQEIVFLAVDRRERRARTTGFMSMCASCGVPYPEQAKQCPHCGWDGQSDEEMTTISGLALEPQGNWTFQLLGQVIERALSSGRREEAEKVMVRAASELDERFAEGRRLQPDEIETITGYALRLARLRGTAEWVDWALRVYRRHELLPPDSILDLLEELDSRSLREVTNAIETFSSWARQNSERPDGVAVKRLEKLAQASTAP